MEAGLWLFFLQRGWYCRHTLNLKSAPGAMLKARRKRAAPDQLYRTCKISGDCPEDIIPRFEQKTVADQILKWGSAFTYFGGAGISTGKGSGGAGGYRPLDVGPPRPPLNTRPIRPPVVPGEIVPPESIPLDTIGPTDSSIVTGADTASVDIVDTAVDSTPASGPEITASNGSQVPEAGDDFPAVLDVQTPEVSQKPSRPQRPPGTSRTTVSQHPNPTFQEPPGIAEPDTSNPNPFIADNVTGTTFVGDIIELDLITGPRESTPTVRGGAKATRGGLTSRQYVQRRLSSYRPIVEIGHTASNVFENPAFEEDSFDIAMPWSPIDPEFEGVTHFGRQITTKAPSGRVAISRVGQASSMQTRSGVSIGPRVHYYGEVSSIGDTSGVTVSTGPRSVPAESPAESIMLDTFSGGYTEADLLDEDLDIHGHLVLSYGSRERTITLPAPDIALQRPFFGAPPTVQSMSEGPWTTGEGIYVDHQDNAIDPSKPLFTYTYDEYTTTVWDPSLFRKKRKRLF